MNHEKEIVDFDTGELEIVNDNFVQLYIDKLDLIIEMMSENPTATKVFTWLLKHMDKRNALVISQQALAEALCLSRMTIHTSTKYLQLKKAVDIFKSGNTNIYAINAQIAWKTTADAKQFAMFDAAVYIAKSEQIEDAPAIKTQLVGHAIKKKAGSQQRQKQLDKAIGLGGSAAMLSMSLCSLLQAITL